MATDGMVVRLVVEQRKRLVASILGHAERQFWGVLTDTEREDFRAKVFEAVGNYSDFMRDILKVVDEDHVRNERALELIEAVHSSQRAIVERLDNPRGR